MRMLVTGGAGFIGSHLSDHLLAGGHQVRALDDLSTGDVANLAEAGRHLDFELVEGTILDEALVDRLVAEADVVVHLAAAVGVRLVVEHPLDSLITNVRGTEHVVTSTSARGRQLLLASSSEVYGRNPDVPLHEGSDAVYGPPSVTRWAYASAKAIDEALVYAHHVEHGLVGTVARFFNTVGPRQSPAYGMVLPRLAAQAVAGDPLTVHGTGQQTRTFCHVDDVVRAVAGLLARPDLAGQAFNVGGGQEIAIVDLATLVSARAGTDAPVELVSYESVFGPGFEDLARRVPDTSRLAGAIGWAPERDLEEIVDDALAAARATAVASPVR